MTTGHAMTTTHKIAHAIIINFIIMLALPTKQIFHKHQHQDLVTCNYW